MRAVTGTLVFIKKKMYRSTSSTRREIHLVSTSKRHVFRVHKADRADLQIHLMVRYKCYVNASLKRTLT